MTTRRRFLQASGVAALGAASALAGCAGAPPVRKPVGRVMVIGAGYGGATAAKYLRLWSLGTIEVLLVDREPMFVSCPGSNLVLGGSRTMAEISHIRNKLRDHGVQLLSDEVISVDPVKRVAKFKQRYADLSYDRLVVSPGVDFIDGALPGRGNPEAQERFLHAWKAGPQTVALRRQLEAMRDGGVFVISVPRSPFPGAGAPYERACQAAFYFRQAKPRSKIILLDANPDITSAPALFRAAWDELYKGMIEYRPNAEAADVDLRGNAVKTRFDTVKGDVLNVVPPMRAGDIARSIGLVNAGNRWCDVDWLSMESTAMRGVHVLGDATLAAPAMLKSGHMANQHGKIAAAAIVELMNGRAPSASPIVSDTCYSFVSDKEALHVSSVHHYDAAKKTLVPVPGAGGVSPLRNEVEGVYAWAAVQNMWADMLT